MPAPTFVAEYESLWSGANPATQTISVTVAVSDVLVVVALTQDNPITVSTPTGGTGIVWELKQSIVIVNYCSAYLWTTVIETAQTFTLSLSKVGTAGGDDWGFNCLRFSSTDGVGASAKANAAAAAPSLALTTIQANSAIVVVNGDWNASNAARTWRTGAGALTEKSYVYAGVNIYTIYVGYHADVGAVGAKTVGLSAPTGQQYSLIAVEVKSGNPAPLALRNNMEGGPPNTVVTTANSNQFGDNPWDAVNSTGANTDLRFAHSDAFGLNRPSAEYTLLTQSDTVGTPYTAWNIAMGDRAEFWARFYIYLPSISVNPGNRALFSVYSFDTLCMSVWLKTSAAPFVLQIRDSASLITSMTTALVGGEWNRIEVRALISGTADLRLYKGDAADSSVATESIAQTGANYGPEAYFEEWRFGQHVTTGNSIMTVYTSSMELNNSGWPGPAPFRAGKGCPGVLTNAIAPHSMSY